MPDDDAILNELAAAILDGTPADWSAIEADTSESTRAIISELRAIAAIGSVTRSFAAGVLNWPVNPPPVRWGHLTLRHTGARRIWQRAPRLGYEARARGRLEAPRVA